MVASRCSPPEMEAQFLPVLLAAQPGCSAGSGDALTARCLLHGDDTALAAILAALVAEGLAVCECTLAVERMQDDLGAPHKTGAYRTRPRHPAQLLPFFIAHRTHAQGHGRAPPQIGTIP